MWLCAVARPRRRGLPALTAAAIMTTVCLACGLAAADSPASAEARVSSPAKALPEAIAARTSAEAHVASIVAIAARVRSLLQSARASRDARVIACVDETLTRVDVESRAARDQAESAFVAWTRGDRRVAHWEMVRLEKHHDLASHAARDADACAPSALGRAVLGPRDATTVRMFVDPSLPTDVVEFPSERR